jgi:hypothetical protein
VAYVMKQISFYEFHSIWVLMILTSQNHEEIFSAFNSLSFYRGFTSADRRYFKEQARLLDNRMRFAYQTYQKYLKNIPPQIFSLIPVHITVEGENSDLQESEENHSYEQQSTATTETNNYIF